MSDRNERRRERRDQVAKLKRASAKLRVANQAFDATTKKQIEEENYGSRITCRRGCYGCCHQLVMSNLAEGVHIVLSYRGLVEKLEAELERQLDVLRELGIVGVDFINDSARRDDFARRYFDKAVLCAFLDRRTGDCMVYSERPHACRQHVLLDFDASVCEPGTPPLTIPSFHHRGLEALITVELKEMMEMTNGRVVAGPLQAVVKSALSAVRKLGL